MYVSNKLSSELFGLRNQTSNHTVDTANIEIISLRGIQEVSHRSAAIVYSGFWFIFAPAEILFVPDHVGVSGTFRKFINIGVSCVRQVLLCTIGWTVVFFFCGQCCCKYNCAEFAVIFCMTDAKFLPACAKAAGRRLSLISLSLWVKRNYAINIQSSLILVWRIFMGLMQCFLWLVLMFFLISLCTGCFTTFSKNFYCLLTSLLWELFKMFNILVITLLFNLYRLNNINLLFLFYSILQKLVHFYSIKR